MKIKILIDNISSAEKQLKGEWGLCVYTEFNGKSILLDTGASTQFAKNATIMGIDISKIDAGVLSHAHYDHADGMQEFFDKNDHAKFYLRDAARENCYHTHKFLKFFTYQEYIGIRKGTLKRNADRAMPTESYLQKATVKFFRESLSSATRLRTSMKLASAPT